MVFYSLLDLASRPVFLFLHTKGIERLDYGVLMLSSGKFSDVVNGNRGESWLYGFFTLVKVVWGGERRHEDDESGES